MHKMNIALQKCKVNLNIISEHDSPFRIVPNAAYLYPFSTCELEILNYTLNCSHSRAVWRCWSVNIFCFLSTQQADSFIINCVQLCILYCKYWAALKTAWNHLQITCTTMKIVVDFRENRASWPQAHVPCTQTHTVTDTHTRVSIPRVRRWRQTTALIILNIFYCERYKRQTVALSVIAWPVRQGAHSVQCIFCKVKTGKSVAKSNCEKKNEIIECTIQFAFC